MSYLDETLGEWLEKVGESVNLWAECVRCVSASERQGSLSQEFVWYCQQRGMGCVWVCVCGCGCVVVGGVE